MKRLQTAKHFSKRDRVRLWKQAHEIREQYPRGAKVRITKMGEPLYICRGTIVTVLNVDDIGTIRCITKSGEIVNLVSGIDEFEREE